MSDQESDVEQAESRSGRCVVCGETWIGLTEDDYTSAASRHIIRQHRDEPLDKVLVEDFNLGSGNDGVIHR